MSSNIHTQEQRHECGHRSEPAAPIANRSGCGLDRDKAIRPKLDRVEASTGFLPIPDYKGPLAFFRRHYYGDYSLARSYWVNTFLLSLLAPVLGVMLLPWLDASFPARYGSTGFLLITTLGIVAWFWAAAGTWASANKHVQRGGKSGWASAAKVMIVLAVLRQISDIGNMMPTLAEHMQVAAGGQLGSSTKLEVRADGRSVLLSGGINDGSAEQLERALQLAPAVTTVVLSSEGGWIREGQFLADIIRKRGLNTYVEGHCASACTIAFLAGRDRAAAPTAKIGFHASRSIGSVAATPSAEETTVLRAIYSSAGLPDAFIRQAIDTPHEQMWYPSHEILLSAGVLTRRSVGGETAALSTVVRTRESLSREFKKVEVFALLANRSPEDFERLMEIAWGEMQQGATDAEIISATHSHLLAALRRFLPLATDETLVAYSALAQEQFESLRERDVAVCVQLAYPSGQSINVAGSLPTELGERERVLLARVLREADRTRDIAPTTQAVGQVLEQAAAGMTQEELTIFSDEEVRRRSSPSATCDAAISFLAGLNKIPRAERGKALRVIYAAAL